MTTNAYPSPVVLAANGPAPTHSVPVNAIRNANTRIAVDGGAGIIRSLGKEPDVILGDMDSVETGSDKNTFPLSDQDKSDLEKSLLWCIEQKIESIDLVSAFGNRDDHSVANYLLLLAYADRIRIKAFSDHYRIEAVTTAATFPSKPGQQVSLVDPSGKAIITTSGLKYTLNHQSLHSASHGVSNETIGSSFKIRVSGAPILVFLTHL